MPTVAKDVLYPGEYHLRDGRKFVCEKSDPGYYAQRMRDMLAAGLHVPLSWEHQDSAKPMTADELATKRADRARLTLGHAQEVRVGAAGELEVVADVPDDGDLRRLPSAKFVSPKIEWNYRDSTNRVWPGPSITHIAVTSNPVQHKQRPFQLAVGDENDPWGGPITLSLDEYQGGMPGTDPTAAMPAPAPVAPQPPPQPLQDPTGRLNEIVSALAPLGIILPQGTTADNFLDRLHTAVLTVNNATDPTKANAADVTRSGYSSKNSESSGGSEEVSPPVVMAIDWDNDIHESGHETLAKKRSDSTKKGSRGEAHHDLTDIAHQASQHAHASLTAESHEKAHMAHQKAMQAHTAAAGTASPEHRQSHRLAASHHEFASIYHEQRLRWHKKPPAHQLSVATPSLYADKPGVWKEKPRIAHHKIAKEYSDITHGGGAERGVHHDLTDAAHEASETADKHSSDENHEAAFMSHRLAMEKHRQQAKASPNQEHQAYHRRAASHHELAADYHFTQVRGSKKPKYLSAAEMEAELEEGESDPMSEKPNPVSEKLKNRVLDMEKQSLRKRIAGLAARGVTKPQIDDLLAELEQPISLSLADDATLTPTPLLIKLTALEGLPKRDTLVPAGEAEEVDLSASGLLPPEMDSKATKEITQTMVAAVNGVPPKDRERFLQAN